MRTLSAASVAGFLGLLVLGGCGGGSDGPADDPPSATVTPTATVMTTPSPAPSSSPLLRPGELDAGFGQDGTVVVPLATEARVPRRGVFVLPDGSVETIVLVARPLSGGTLARLFHVAPDGGVLELERTGASADDSVEHAAFDDDGNLWIVHRPSGGLELTHATRLGTNLVSEGEATRVALTTVSDVLPLPEGGVLLVGRANQDASGLQRFDANGHADPSFGTSPNRVDGLVLGPPPDADGGFSLSAAGVDGRGRILVAGVHTTLFVFLPIVVAYDRDGALDHGFGDGGIAEPGGLIGGSPAIAVAADGRSVFAGDANGLLRFAADGRPEVGVVLDGGVAALSLGPSGDLTAVGATFVADDPRRFDCSTSSGGVCLRLGVAVWRLLPNGAPDARFGTNGTAVTDTDPPYGAQDTGFTTLISAPADRITAAGTVCRAAFVCDLAVVRYGDVTR